MAGGYGSNVDPSQIAAAAQRVADATDVITGLENQVDSHLNNLRGGWKGPAASQFEQVVLSWLLDFRDIRFQLNDISQGLTGTHKVYTANEQAEQAGINRLRSWLNQG